MRTPADVALDAAGNLYISDPGNARIRKVDTAGIITTIAGNGVFDASGDGGPALSASMIPSPWPPMPPGRTCTAQTGTYRVRRIDLVAGTIHAFAGIPFDFSFPFFGGDGGPAVDAKIDQPYHLAVDPAGNVFINDFGNSRIRKVDTSGIITSVAGNGDYASAPDGSVAVDSPVNFPGSLAVSDGEIYFTELFANRVVRIDTNGIIHAVAGTGTPGFSGDGAGDLGGIYRFHTDVGVDGAGNVYIADQGTA